MAPLCGWCSCVEMTTATNVLGHPDKFHPEQFFSLHSSDDQHCGTERVLANSPSIDELI